MDSCWFSLYLGKDNCMAFDIVLVQLNGSITDHLRTAGNGTWLVAGT